MIGSTTRISAVVLVIVGTLWASAAANAGGWRRKRCCECPKNCRCLPTVKPAPSDATPTMPEAESETSQALASPEPSTSSLETASSTQTLAPNMIGDLFGVGGNFFLGYRNANNEGVSANNASAVNGGRRLKIGEAVSPMPRNRFFFTYNLFRGPYRTEAPSGGVDPLGLEGDAPMGSPSIGGAFGPEGAGSRNFDVNRFTFGVEKTFFGGNASVELRIPFSRTLSTDLQISDDGTIPGESAAELDNISVALKTLLHQTDRCALSAGLVINTPTADDINISQQFQQVNGLPIGHELQISNDSIHLGPFFGYLLTPTERLFVQGFLQYEFGINSNQVLFTPRVGGVVEPTQEGNLFDQRLMLLDVAVGYWVYRNPSARWVRGVAPILELHYTTTTTNASLLAFNNNNANYMSIVGNTLNRIDVVNMTMGTALSIGDRGSLSSGVVIPLNRGDHNFLFDWEFNVQLNYRFGPANRGPSNVIYN